MLMKNTYYKHIAIILLFLTGLSSCVDNTFTASAEKEVSADFSLDEAKCYYQRQAKSCGIMADNINKITLSPGDIVPQWNSAVFSMQGNVACYDIPINASYYYQAIRSQKRNGILTAEKSGVYQRLIILKNLANKQLSHYILSLIPDKSCEQQCKQDAFSIFRTRGNKSRFSGIAMYSFLYKSRIIEVDLYSQGNKTLGVSLLDIKGYDDCKIKTCKLKDVLSSISFQKRKKLITRGEYDIDGGWLDEVVITPDEPWDGTGADGMTNEEWLDSTRPDGNVDQEPEPEPEPDTNDWENEYISESENDKQSEDEIISEVRQNLKPILQKVNIDINKYTIRRNKDICITNARTMPDNTIELCTNFFRFNKNDQASILWHEIYHINNFHNKENHPSKEITIHISNRPEDSIRNGMISYLEWAYPELKNSYYGDVYISDIAEAEYHIINPYDIQWYINELDAYSHEKENGIEKSDYYNGFLDFMIWKNTEIINELNK